ncbi:MAG: hypothetical protein HKM23_04095 [Nitrosopumilus sp.]|nr:hypothetical protein [Nitrosopumilus sp.]NNL58256.1 hypothetical protein [Nitrosopumilus sp.]
MPDVSCRRCGAELQIHLKCFQCSEPIQEICKNCSKTTQIKFHSQCMYNDLLSHTVASLA